MAISGYQCPRCKGADVYRSRRRGFDKPMSLLGLYPYICEEFTCRKRFYRRSRSGVSVL